MTQLFLPFLQIYLILLPVSLSIQCPTGWSESATGGSNKCYLAMPVARNWFDAEVYCHNAAPNAHLTSVSSSFENANVNAQTSALSSCYQFWIGANDISQSGQYSWTDGLPFQFVNWATDQPNHSDMCVSLEKTTGQWKTDSCNTISCFVCESYTIPPTTPAPTTPPPCRAA